MVKSADNRRSNAQAGARDPGRPVKPQDGSKSALAALGVQLRERRLERALTFQNLAELTGYSFQHLGAVERALLGSAPAAGHHAAASALDEQARAVWGAAGG